MSILEQSPFIPHSYQHLVEVRAFPKNAVPEPAYAKISNDYAALTDIAVSRIVYSSDGLKIVGVMALPKEIKKGQHPVLIYNRGGNGEYGKLTVFSVMRYMVPFVRKGMLVFASNYRGNDGSEGCDEFGGADINDVSSLLEIAKNHEGFDGRNAYMLGHSRGGMMTYRSIRNQSPVNAAIAVAGVSHLKQSGKERPEMVEHVYNKRFPNTQEEYEKRSALCWPQDISVPLMLLHGDADEAVNVSHSIRLDAALTAHRKPHALHIYEGGNHSLHRFWDDVVARSYRWMEDYRQ